MLDKLAQIETRYEELTNELSSPELLSNPSAYGKAAKQHRSLGEIVEKYRAWKTLNEELTGARQLTENTEDEEMRELARVEIEALQAQLEQAENDLKLLLIPRDPNDEKNVILEIRAGTGGDEASLFAADILRMYARYAERQRWKMEILDASETGIGGLKEAVALIEGDKVYSKLKHESGVHRVQRVPQTEASGRIHTSAITVAVLPEAEEVDVKIDRERSAHRYLLFFGSGRPVGEHDLLGGAHHAPADQRRRFDAGRKIADQESRKSHAGAARAFAGT